MKLSNVAAIVAALFGLLLVVISYALPVAFVTATLGWGVGLLSIPATVYLCRKLYRPTFALTSELNAFAALVYGVSFAGFIVGLCV